MREDLNTNTNNKEFEDLVNLLLKERSQRKLDERNEKLKKVLLLLAKGTTLATALAMPKTARLLSQISFDKSDIAEWKQFNKSYLKRTIKSLERQKIVEVEDQGNVGIVKLTQKGKSKILKFGLESLTISKPSAWDKRWRLVFYDVTGGKQTTRDKLRHYLLSAGFYPFQESVYLHAYPCEQEVEFLRHFLGISGEVKIIIAEKVENDQVFRDFFGL